MHDHAETELEVYRTRGALSLGPMVRENRSDVNGIIYARRVFGDNAENGSYLVTAITRERNDCH